MKVDSLLYAGNNLGPATCRQAPVRTRTATCESGGDPRRRIIGGTNVIKLEVLHTPVMEREL